jgi:creatinine amidohydrolase
MVKSAVPPKRDWAEMTWEDFSSADAAGWIAVLPIAAIEQHGPHLPLGVDAFIATAYLLRARAMLPAELPVTFLPMLKIGTSHEHRAYPGTLTFSPQTVVRMLTEIGESVHRSGLRKFVIANSHGGNMAAIGLAVRDLRARLGIFAVTCAFSRLGYPEGLFGDQEHRHGIHGGDIETSIMLAHRPDTVRSDRAGNFRSAAMDMEHEFKWLRTERPSGFGWAIQDLNACGAVGNASAANAEKGERAITFGARALIELLGEVNRFDLARLKAGPL